MKILIFFSTARKIPLILLYFLSRNVFSIKLVCHTENRFILERLVKINSYLTKSPSAKCMKSVYYSRLKLNIFSTSSYPLALRILLLQHLLFQLLFLWELIYFSYE